MIVEELGWQESDYAANAEENTLIAKLLQHVDAWTMGENDRIITPDTFSNIISKPLTVTTRVVEWGDAMLFEFKAHEDTITDEVVPVWRWMTSRRCKLRNWLEYRVCLFLTKAAMLLNCTALANKIVDKAASAQDELQQNTATWWMPTMMGHGSERPYIRVLVQNTKFDGYIINLLDPRVLLPWWPGARPAETKQHDCALVAPLMLIPGGENRGQAVTLCAQELRKCFDAICFAALMSATVGVLKDREDFQFAAVAPVAVPVLDGDKRLSLSQFMDRLYTLREEYLLFRTSDGQVNDASQLQLLARALHMAEQDRSNKVYPTLLKWWQACVNAAMECQLEEEWQTNEREYVHFY